MHQSAGIAMKKKVLTAALDMAEHVIEHNELVSTIPQQALESWTARIEEWERDSTKPNPFDETTEGMCRIIACRMTETLIIVLRVSQAAVR
jgi:hypothetical protein